MRTALDAQQESGEHTPGPWSIPHFAKPDVNCECGYVLCDHMMGAVATVHCSGDGDDWKKQGDNPKYAEAVANAHLIATAPELFAYVQQRANCGDPVAQKLIAKATGAAQ